MVWSNKRKATPTMRAGRDMKSMNTLMKTDQVNRGIFIHVTPGARMVNTVVMKFTPPSVEEAPSISMPEMNAVVPGFAP